MSRGYKVRLFVPEKFSEEKVIIMRALGAEVTRTPEAEGMQGAIQRAKDLLTTDPSAFMAAQFDNPANTDYHYETTAREIFEQMEGRIDAINSRMRYSRNLYRGCALSKRADRQDTCCRSGNPRLDPRWRKARSSQSGRDWQQFYSWEFDPSVCDEVFMVTDDQAFGMVKELAATEGVLEAQVPGPTLMQRSRLPSVSEQGSAW